MQNAGRLASALGAALFAVAPQAAAQPPAPGVTFTRDIAPLL